MYTPWYMAMSALFTHSCYCRLCVGYRHKADKRSIQLKIKLGGGTFRTFSANKKLSIGNWRVGWGGATDNLQIILNICLICLYVLHYYEEYCLGILLLTLSHLRHLKSNNLNLFSESFYGKYLQVLYIFYLTTWRTSRTTSRWSSTQKVRATKFS